MWLYCLQSIKLAVLNIWKCLLKLHVTSTRNWNKNLWFKFDHNLGHLWFQTRPFMVSDWTIHGFRLDHRSLWFQANHTLSHIWFQIDHVTVQKSVWFVWYHIWSEYDQPGRETRVWMIAGPKRFRSSFQYNNFRKGSFKLWRNGISRCHIKGSKIAIGFSVKRTLCQVSCILLQYPKNPKVEPNWRVKRGDHVAFLNIHCCKTSKNWRGTLWCFFANKVS